jgi:hypothetical protein
VGALACPSATLPQPLPLSSTSPPRPWFYSNLDRAVGILATSFAGIVLLLSGELVLDNAHYLFFLKCKLLMIHAYAFGRSVLECVTQPGPNS